MRLGIYSIRDNLTGFLTPVVEQNDSVARRNFEHAIMNPQSLMHSHVSDYDLYKLGYFDTESGVVEQAVPIELIVAGGSINAKVQSL